MELKKTTRSLKCILTEQELKQVAEQMAQTYTDLQSEEDGLKSVTAQFKARIAGMEANISLYANKIQNKFEFRMIDCHQEEKGSDVIMIRDDTKEVIETRPMTKEELQENFDFVEKEKQEQAKKVNKKEK